MYVVNQPWNGRGQRMGDYLIQLLSQEEPRFESFRVCVAYAKASGILRIIPALQVFLVRGGYVEFVIGIDGAITTRQALELVMRYSSLSYVFNNPSTTFHPKVYLFERKGKAVVAFIGSSNLTSGGLFTNYEANICLELDLGLSKDQDIYQGLLSIFRYTTDLSSGNSKELNSDVITDLVSAHFISDEAKRTVSNVTLRGKQSGIQSLFPRQPIPPAPRINSDLQTLVPKVKPVIRNIEEQNAFTAFHPWETFVMILGARDTRQQTGYSRDIYIPLAARGLFPDFWGWPIHFSEGITETVGNYQERRIDMLVRPVSGIMQFVENIRLYHYDIKHEFRVNCGRLIQGAKAGDLLLIQKSPVGTLLEGKSYEYEATVISDTSPSFQTFSKECKNKVPHSNKRWGYL